MRAVASLDAAARASRARLASTIRAGGVNTAAAWATLAADLAARVADLGPYAARNAAALLAELAPLTAAVPPALLTLIMRSAAAACFAKRAAYGRGMSVRSVATRAVQLEHGQVDT